MKASKYTDEYEWYKDLMEYQKHIKFHPRFENDIGFKGLSDAQLEGLIVQINNELRFRELKRKNA